VTAILPALFPKVAGAELAERSASRPAGFPREEKLQRALLTRRSGRRSQVMAEKHVWLARRARDLGVCLRMDRQAALGQGTTRD